MLPLEMAVQLACRIRFQWFGQDWKIGASDILPHGRRMSYRINSFLEVYERVTQALLMLNVFSKRCTV